MACQLIGNKHFLDRSTGHWLHFLEKKYNCVAYWQKPTTAKTCVLRMSRLDISSLLCLRCIQKFVVYLLRCSGKNSSEGLCSFISTMHCLCVYEKDIYKTKIISIHQQKILSMFSWHCNNVLCLIMIKTRYIICMSWVKHVFNNFLTFMICCPILIFRITRYLPQSILNVT